MYIQYYAYNTSTGAGAYVTGDGGNHTLKLIKDGTEANPTNGESEVDSTNCPGLYQVQLTTSETAFNVVRIAGKSSTANVILVGTAIGFELLPTALTAGNNVKADAIAVGGTAQTAIDLGTEIPNLSSAQLSGFATVQTNTNALSSQLAGLTSAQLNGFASIPTTAAISDKILGRNLAGGSDGGRTVQDALRALRNKVDTTQNPAVIYKEDDATTAWTTTLTSAAVNPVVTSDPT